MGRVVPTKLLSPIALEGDRGLDVKSAQPFAHDLSGGMPEARGGADAFGLLIGL